MKGKTAGIFSEMSVWLVAAVMFIFFVLMMSAFIVGPQKDTLLAKVVVTVAVVVYICYNIMSFLSVLRECNSFRKKRKISRFAGATIVLTAYVAVILFTLRYGRVHGVVILFSFLFLSVVLSYCSRYRARRVKQY